MALALSLGARTRPPAPVAAGVNNTDAVVSRARQRSRNRAGLRVRKSRWFSSTRSALTTTAVTVQLAAGSFVSLARLAIIAVLLGSHAPAHAQTINFVPQFFFGDSQNFTPPTPWRTSLAQAWADVQAADYCNPSNHVCYLYTNLRPDYTLPSPYSWIYNGTYNYSEWWDIQMCPKLWCRPLPPQLPEWERVANLPITPRH